MRYPYLLMADLHLHRWSQFATTNADGVNSRLQINLNEIERGAEELHKAGGSTIVFGGDIFHVRGSVAPDVFNPFADLVDSLLHKGYDFVALPGNHDLADKETTKLGNSFQSLTRQHHGAYGFEVATEPKLYADMLLVPWHSTLDGLDKAIGNWIASDTSANGVADAASRAKIDLIIHAGIDGVLKDMPDHGLTAAKLASYGFRRVWAGHYHHAKDFGNGVYSIGAAAHQTWSDVGTKAGFWLVYEDHAQWFASHAPEFIDITPDVDPDDWALIVPGHYVRVHGFKMSNVEIEETRKTLVRMNAAGVVFQVARAEPSARASSKPAAPMSMEASLSAYITKQITDAAMAAKVDAACRDVLSVVTTTS